MIKFLKIAGKAFIGILILLFVLSIIMFFSIKGEFSVAKTVDEDPSIPHIELDGVTFHSETFGNDTSEVVIIIHGGPGNDYRYLLPLKPLSEKYYLVFYDQRGTGLSPRVEPEEQSLENSLKDLKNIVDHYASDRKVNLIGHSYGAMLASGFIARYPERVNKAVLAEPGMLTSEKAKEFMDKFKMELDWESLKSLTQIAFESLHIDAEDDQARMDYIFGKISGLDFDGNPMKQYFCNDDPKSGYIKYWRLSSVASQEIIGKSQDEDGNIQIDLVSGLENFPNKVLFMVGECDELTGEDFQKGHMKYFPNAEMVVIKNAGHTMLGEKPEECMKVIERYFEE